MTNIIWITIESTRADHTSLHSYDRDTTPNLQRIADLDGGRSFSTCISHGIWTRSSSASILTGTWPSRHRAGMDSERIPTELMTVPELLREEGYHTAAMSPNANLSSGTGLDRGFTDFMWIDKSTLLDDMSKATLLKYLFNIRTHGGGLTRDTWRHNTGYMMLDMTKRWLRSFLHSTEPFFLYLHFGDPHHPYYPPLPILKRETARLGLSPKEAEEIALHHHSHIDELVAQGCPYTEEEWRALTALYDGGIEYADKIIGELFDYASALNLDNTVFVITADHGESLGEQNLLGHKIGVHDGLIHVPLIVYGSEEMLDYAGETIQHIDVMKTLLESIGSDTSQLQGIDLRNETRTHTITQRGPCRRQRTLDAYREFNPDFDVSRYLPGMLTAIRTTKFKYLKGENDSRLYRLPDENTDVAAYYDNVTQQFDEKLTRWWEHSGKPITDSEPIDSAFTEALREQLTDLGYFVE
ncbi:sulfatase [Halocatena pleomorpha]|uniref:Sulfatase n=1 Tax=Halocatena pleomorpha TaxID=1785090 RepID=A0A3P3REQ1_9EURY|nr:sulfatase [Halocatena pleomorpha]RRJ31399.1 sulfatase [Halocatena pleomorpha]